MKWCVVLIIITRLSGAELGNLTVDELSARADLPAKVELAHRQLDGRIQPLDQKFVLETFQKGSGAGLARAHTGFGSCYLWGVGMDPDETKAAELFQKAAEMGDALGTFRSGEFLRKTRGPARDSQRGMKMIEKALGMGSINAESYLANCQLYGGGVPRDLPAGLATLHALAEEKGNAQAAVYLGFHYRDGVRDPKQAEKFFRMAAEKNHAAALVALGDSAMNNGGWKDNKKAKQEGAMWYRKAVARNSAEGMCKLGIVQVRDTSVREKGEDWYQLWLDADRLGNREATLRLANIHYHAPGYFFRDLDWSKSAMYYQKWLAGNTDFSNTYTTIDYLLEIYYSGGLGLERDYKKCLEIAHPYLGDHTRACLYVGRILLHPDLPMGKSRENIIRGYACMLKSRQLWKENQHKLYPISDEAMFVLRSRHGMTQGEVGRAEELFRQGYPSEELPILP